MFQSSVSNILSRFDSKSAKKSELSEINIEFAEEPKSPGYSWKSLVKAGSIFVVTTGAFLALKTTGSFSLISSWLKNSSPETDLNESSTLANFDNPSTQTHITLASEEQPFIAHQYAKREPSAIVKIGPEFQVNTYTTHDQSKPSVAELSNGKFVVAWESQEQDEPNYGIYGQMFNADSSKYFSEFRVNTYTIDDQIRPSVAKLSDGKFVVTWQSVFQDGHYYGIYGQIFNDNSSKYLSEFQVNTYTSGEQSKPSVAGLSNGKFIVTWESFAQEEDGESYGIYGQIFNDNGTKYLSEFRVNTYTIYDQSEPSVAGLSNGKFVVTWQSYGQDGDGWGVYGQMFDADGIKYGSEFRVNTYTTSYQSEPSVAGLSNSKFVVTWQSREQDGSGYGVYGQMYNADGSKYASEFLINAYTANDQCYSSVVGLNDGKFVVTWGSEGNIYGQMFNADSTKYLSEFQVNTYTISYQGDPSVRGLSDGKFVVVWESYIQDGHGLGIYSQMFKENATPVLGNNQLTINEGGTITITGAILNATDVDNNDADLRFDISNLQNGQFEVETSPGNWEVVTSFTQQRITDNQIRFVHDGSENAPGYDVAVSDGSLSTPPIPASIVFIPASKSSSLISSSKMSSSSSTPASSLTVSSSSLSQIVSSSYQIDSVSSSKIESSPLSSTRSVVSRLSSLSVGGSSTKSSEDFPSSSNLVSSITSSSGQVDSISSSNMEGSSPSSTKSVMSKLDSTSTVSDLSEKSSGAVISNSNLVSSSTSSKVTQDSSITQSNIDSNTISSLGLEDSDEGSLPGKIWRILGPVLGLLGPSMLGLTGFAIQRHINRIDKFKKKYPLAANLLGVRKYSLLTKASKEFVKFIHRPTNGLVDKLKSRKVDYDSYLGDDQRLIREFVSNEIGDLAQRSNVYWIFNQKAIIQAISVLDRQSDDIADRIVKNFNRRITVVSVGVPITVPSTSGIPVTASSTSATPCSADEVVVTEVRPSNLAQEEIQTNYALELSKADQSLQQALGEDLSNKYNSYESEQKAAENESDEESSQRTLSL